MKDKLFHQPQLTSLVIQVKNLSESIKISHTALSFPFAIVAYFYAVGREITIDALWIILAIVAARIFGMLANRLIDSKIDRLNPRTANRPTANGTLKLITSLLALITSITIYGVSVSQLHQITWYLSIIPLLVMIIYPYLKRVTFLSHIGIGIVYFILPSGVFIAITGVVDVGIILISVAASFWIIGLDIIYAVQDYEFDVKNGYHSIPQKFGIKIGLNLALASHFVVTILLIMAGLAFNISWYYYITAVLYGIFLLYTHFLIRKSSPLMNGKDHFLINSLILFIWSLAVSGILLWENT